MTTLSSITVETVREAARRNNMWGRLARGRDVEKQHADWQWAGLQHENHEFGGRRPLWYLSGPNMGPLRRLSVLPKANARTAFRLLRPVAILLASAKLWGRCFFTILTPAVHPCDLVVRAANLDAMAERNAPLPLALAYVREANRACIISTSGYSCHLHRRVTKKRRRRPRSKCAKLDTQARV